MSTFIKRLQATILGSSFLGLMSLNNPAFAVTFRTHFSFYSNPGKNGETQWYYDWTGTYLNNDLIIDETELTHWSANLLAGSNRVYSEDVIIDGQVQPIGGVQRQITDINFEYSLIFNKVLDASNDNPIINNPISKRPVQEQSIGTTYFFEIGNDIGHGRYVGWERYDNGLRSLEQNFKFSYVESRSIIPEPTNPVPEPTNPVPEPTNPLPEPNSIPEPSFVIGLLCSGLMLRKMKKVNN